MLNQERLATANRLLKLLENNSACFSIVNNKLQFYWADWRGVLHSRQWQTQRHSDSFPVFGHALAKGGTYCNAICQLARWVQGRNVYPLRIWEGWLKNGLGILENRAEILSLLTKEWPHSVICVKCGAELTKSFDWFGWGAKSGCGCRDGCRSAVEIKLANCKILED